MSSVFAYCTSLQTINIPASVTSITGSAFIGCTALKNIEIALENNTYTMTNGILMNKAKTSMIFMVNNASAIEGGTFTVPQGVTTLPGGFLGNFNQITKVKIPSSINSIETGFFTKNITEIEIDENNQNYVIKNKMILSKDGTTLVYYYANGTTVNVPEGVTTITTRALNGTGGNNVTEVNLSEDLTTIKNYAIGCPNLTHIDIGENVSNIHPLAFYDSGITTEMTIDEGNNYYIFENGALYNKNKTKLVRVFTKDEEFNIPDGVTEIGNYAFHGKTITKVKIPETVTNIGNSFGLCSKLAEIEIPSSVQTIGTTTFDRCSSLKSIKIHKEKDSIQGSPWGAPIGARAVEWLGE